MQHYNAFAFKFQLNDTRALLWIASQVSSHHHVAVKVLNRWRFVDVHNVSVDHASLRRPFCGLADLVEARFSLDSPFICHFPSWFPPQMNCGNDTRSHLRWRFGQILRCHFEKKAVIQNRRKAGINLGGGIRFGIKGESNKRRGLMERVGRG